MTIPIATVSIKKGGKGGVESRFQGVLLLIISTTVVRYDREVNPMKRSGFFCLILALPLTLIMGCGQEQAVSTEPVDHSGEQLLPDSLAPIVGLLADYPGYCFHLNMRWLRQFPPGDQYNTKNCGQACGVMLGGYFNNGYVEPWVITAENQFLADRLDDSRFDSPNGWYTNFSGRNALGILLTEFHGLHYTVYYGNRANDVINEVAHGHPVICGVMIKKGRIVSSGGTAHWVLAVGWNGNVILHDPGSSYGCYRQISVSDFEASWATQGKIYVPVRR